MSHTSAIGSQGLQLSTSISVSALEPHKLLAIDEAGYGHGHHVEPGAWGVRRSGWIGGLGCSALWGPILHERPRVLRWWAKSLRTQRGERRCQPCWGADGRRLKWVIAAFCVNIPCFNASWNEHWNSGKASKSRWSKRTSQQMRIRD